MECDVLLLSVLHGGQRHARIAVRGCGEVVIDLVVVHDHRDRARVLRMPRLRASPSP